MVKMTPTCLDFQWSSDFHAKFGHFDVTEPQVQVLPDALGMPKKTLVLFHATSEQDHVEVKPGTIILDEFVATFSNAPAANTFLLTSGFAPANHGDCVSTWKFFENSPPKQDLLKLDFEQIALLLSFR